MPPSGHALSFSIAARNLFISQSAVSQTISSIEKELQTQLFIRNSKGVSLTLSLIHILRQRP